MRAIVPPMKPSSTDIRSETSGRPFSAATPISGGLPTRSRGERGHREAFAKRSFADANRKTHDLMGQGTNGNGRQAQIIGGTGKGPATPLRLAAGAIVHDEEGRLAFTSRIRKRTSGIPE